MRARLVFWGSGASRTSIFLCFQNKRAHPLAAVKAFTLAASSSRSWARNPFVSNCPRSGLGPVLGLAWLEMQEARLEI